RPQASISEPKRRRRSPCRSSPRFSACLQRDQVNRCGKEKYRSMQLWNAPTCRRFQSDEMSPPSHIAAIILAAGESSRLGQPKQLIQFRGKTLVRRVVDAASEAGCQPILVVVGSSKLVQGISAELKN